jgi:hypothetical protein
VDIRICSQRGQTSRAQEGRPVSSSVICLNTIASGLHCASDGHRLLQTGRVKHPSSCLSLSYYPCRRSYSNAPLILPTSMLIACMTISQVDSMNTIASGLHCASDGRLIQTGRVKHSSSCLSLSYYPCRRSYSNAPLILPMSMLIACMTISHVNSMNTIPTAVSFRRKE